jgi:hypothetical protein
MTFNLCYEHILVCMNDHGSTARNELCQKRTVEADPSGRAV